MSAYYLWRAVAGDPDSSIYYDFEIVTFQVTGPGVDGVIAVMTPLLVVVVGCVAALGAFKAWRGASFARLFPALALALVLAFIVVNKVGSPQFLTWLIAPLAFGLVIDRRWWPLAAAGLAAAGLTQLLYPVLYGMLLNADSLAAAILTARNALLAVMLVLSVVALARVPVRAKHPPAVV